MHGNQLSNTYAPLQGAMKQPLKLYVRKSYPETNKANFCLVQGAGAF